MKERAAGLLEVLRTAAPTDPELADLWNRIQEEFHANQRAIVEALVSKNALRPGLDAAEATDILWALNHPSMYQLLVGDRGWTPARYEEWLGDAFCSQLLET